MDNAFAITTRDERASVRRFVLGDGSEGNGGSR
jgi:hypothetical protein